METRNTPTTPTVSEGKILGLANPVYDGTPGTEFDLFGDGSAYERFAPGAFDKWLSGKPDIKATFNHNYKGLPLGRTKNQTLKVWADKRGLHYEVTPPDTSSVRELRAAIERQDVDGSSISFEPTDYEWLWESGKDVRFIKEAKVYELGPVTDAAYSATSVGVRSNERAALVKERDDFRDRIETEKRLARWAELNK